MIQGQGEGLTQEHIEKQTHGHTQGQIQLQTRGQPQRPWCQGKIMHDWAVVRS